MKVLGLSFGRNMSNCEVMTKEVLLKCKEQGHEIQFINVNKLDIKHCTGCIACVISMIAHKKNAGKCVMKDDFHILDEAIMEADAVILASPTFEVGATGLYRTICDRIGPSHDLTFRKAAIDEGCDTDVRSLKNRVCGLISVGGAMTENWTVLTLPMMYAIPMSMGMDVVDMINYHQAMATYNVVGNKPVMDRCGKMAEAICDALNNMEDEEARKKWRGDKEGACPVCHLNLVNISDDQTYVECPVCGIRGEISFENGKLSISYSEAEKNRSRLAWAGKLEHSTEIKTQAVGPDSLPNVKELLEPYRW